MGTTFLLGFTQVELLSVDELFRSQCFRNLNVSMNVNVYRRVSWHSRKFFNPDKERYIVLVTREHLQLYAKL